MFIQILKPACKITMESFGTTTVITMKGSADLTAVDRLQDELDKAMLLRPRTLVFDLGELEFISSLAVGSMIAAAKHIQRLDGTVRIINARPLVLELIRVTKLDEIFEIGL